VPAIPLHYIVAWQRRSPLRPMSVR
jgi:hypothetical protein